MSLPPSTTKLPCTLLVLLLAVGSLCNSALALDTGLEAGVLDNPLPSPGRQNLGINTQNLRPATTNPAAAQRALQAAVEQEQKDLEKLDRETLKGKAQNGERAAQVVLAADYAKEASLLSFAPAAANDALSDAARWYSLAASRGFPGAPSLDQAGIRFYPIRIQREIRR